MSLQTEQLIFQVDTREIAAELEVAPGTVRGLFGVSGVGKSTLFSLLAGQGQSTFSGKIYYDGQSLEKLQADQKVAFVSLMFQNPDTQFCMATPAEELIFCLENQRVPKEQISSKVAAALAFCEIPHLAQRSLAVLSGGEKQLVALACCVALGSRYLLLDEPFANLDEATTAFVIGKLQQLQQSGVGILMIDHQLKNTKGWIDEWYVLDQTTLTLKTRAQLEAASEQQKRRQPRLAKIAPTRPVLQLKNFSLPLADHQLRLPDRTLKAGQMIGLTGRSGLGKSTLLKALIGAVEFTGTIELNHRSVQQQRRQIFKQLSWIMQNPQDQFVAATVFQELANGQQADLWVEQKLRELQLEDKRSESPFLLSQGQQRRLAVACFLERPVDVLLVDEPTYGQDQENAWQVMRLLQQKANEETLVLIVSHDQELLQTFCDEVWDLNQMEEPRHEKIESDHQIRRYFTHRFTRLFSK